MAIYNCQLLIFMGSNAILTLNRFLKVNAILTLNRFLKVKGIYCNFLTSKN